MSDYRAGVLEREHRDERLQSGGLGAGNARPQIIFRLSCWRRPTGVASTTNRQGSRIVNIEKAIVEQPRRGGIVAAIGPELGQLLVVGLWASTFIVTKAAFAAICRASCWLAWPAIPSTSWASCWASSAHRPSPARC